MLAAHFTPTQRAEFERALDSDRSLAEGLAPLLAGEHGKQARAAVLDAIATRMAAGDSIDEAVLPAFAAAVRVAHGQDDTSRGTSHDSYK